MNIAFCIAIRQWGGVKTFFLEFGETLQNMGHSVFFYGREGAFIERAHMLSLYAKPVTFKRAYSPSTIRFFYKEFLTNNIDIVVGNVGKDITTAGVASYILGIPFVQTVGLPSDISSRLSVKLRHYVLRPKYLSTCKFIQDGMLEYTPYIEEKDCFYVDSGKIPTTNPRKTIVYPLQFVTAGRIVEGKGHKQLLDALKILHDKGYDFIWNIYGEGALREGLQKYTEDLGLSSKVIWHGFVQNVMEKLYENDVFILSSEWEGLPNVLLEAYAMGLIVVARAICGVPSAFPKELPQLLVKDEDGAIGFARALEHILQANEEILMKWKDIFWEQCNTNYHLEKQAKKLVDSFSVVIREYRDG